MSKNETVDPKTHKEVVTLIDTIVEPKLKKFVAVINERLKEKNVNLGMEVTWFINPLKGNQDDSET